MLCKWFDQTEEKLPEKYFFRANRQQIINTKSFQDLVPWFKGKLKLTMRNGEEVEVSPRQSYFFKDRMGLK